MWFFVLIINLVALFIFYRIINDRMVKNSALDEVISKYRKEIDLIVINFNKSSFENITLLEEKITEVREFLRILNAKLEENKKNAVQAGVSKKIFLAVPDIGDSESPEVSMAVLKEKKTAQRNKNKEDTIQKYVKDGASVSEIAERLDISREEVRYYIQRSSS